MKMYEAYQNWIVVNTDLDLPVGGFYYPEDAERFCRALLNDFPHMPYKVEKAS